ncbi:MAG: pantetheine-phosphate adenylyltransferase [bacterium]
MIKKAIYPGSFDPLTNGHLDLIKRGVAVFGGLTVAVAENVKKTPLFSVGERLEMIGTATSGLPEVTVISFEGLLTDYCRSAGINIILRGLRVVSDFEAELQSASINRQLCPELETVFMTPSDDCAYLSSSIVKELAGLSGKIEKMVPPIVYHKLKERFKNGSSL